ncbi:MAG: hypothetical protein QXM43_07375 [Desulfurococcaceae archaeon]
MRFCIYGNPTIDIIKENPHSEYVEYGGGSYYSSLPLIKRGLSIEVYAVYSPAVSGHPVAEYIIKQQYSSNVNIFKIEYHGLNRTLSVVDKAPQIYDWNTHVGFCYVIVNPVLGEVSINMLRRIKLNSLILAVDLQGYLRKIVNGNIILEYNPDIEVVFELADVIHADLDEYEVISRNLNSTNIQVQALKKLRGVLVVTARPNRIFIITSNKTKIIELNEDYYAQVKTGAGDYFLATYTYYYCKTSDEEESSYLAHEHTTRWLMYRDNVRPHHTPTTQHISSTRIFKNTSP